MEEVTGIGTSPRCVKHAKFLKTKVRSILDIQTLKADNDTNGGKNEVAKTERVLESLSAKGIKEILATNPDTSDGFWCKDGWDRR